MSVAVITFSELEGQSYSVMAEASHAIAAISRRSDLALAHVRCLKAIRSTSVQLSALLQLLHSPESIAALEAPASAAKAARVTGHMRDVASKVTEAIDELHSLDVGHWKPVYKSYVTRLVALNAELVCHVNALESGASTFLWLTKADQDRLVSVLQNPPAPNEALRRAFARN
jgi:hypothetical protein